MKKALAAIVVVVSALSLLVTAQVPAQSQPPVYQPKFAGDKAHSDAEAAALGYMRTVLVAEKLYKKKHGVYAHSLASLVGNGSFTRRMTNTDRGDYMVSFRPKREGYSLALTPAQFDAQHRAFYVDETGEFRYEVDKPATASSPLLK